MFTWRDSEWRERAACQGVDVDIFFPETERGGSPMKEGAQAFQICARCPVKRECAKDALNTGEQYGIRAGIILTPTQSAGRRRRKLLSVIVEAA